MRKSDEFKVKLEDINSKVELAHEELKLLREILAVNTEQLRIHIQGVEQTRQLIAMKEQEMAARMAPIEDHVKLINTLTKIVAWSVALPGAIYYIIQVLRLLK